MDKDGVWRKILELIFRGKESELREFLEELRKGGPEERFMASLAEVHSLAVRHRPADALRRGERLPARAPDRWFMARICRSLGIACMNAGDLSRAEEMFGRAVEVALDKDKELIGLFWCYIQSERFGKASETLSRMDESRDDIAGHRLYCRAMLEMLRGEITKALATFRSMPQAEFLSKEFVEMRGFLRRTTGDISGAREDYLSCLMGNIEIGSAYAVFPLAKYHELVVLAGLSPIEESLEKKALSLARKGGIQEGAALDEIEAMGLWKQGQIAEAAEAMLRAGQGYALGGQPIEAFMAHIRSAYLSYRSRTNLFWEALEYIGHRIGFYGFIGNDHFYGDFVNRVLAPMLSYESGAEPEIKLWFFGGMRALGLREPERWFSKKALSLLKYLVLNQGKGLHSEYLAYLLWPKANTARGKSRLKVAVAAIRKELPREMLVYAGNSYVLRENPRLWIDVHEFQNLLREAEALDHNQVLQLEKYLKALELYRDKLLPEDRYDRFIEEHRDYFHKRFQRALEKTINLLMNAGRDTEALELSGGFHMRFPEDDSVARVYIDALVSLGRTREAEKVYGEFKKRLWREHRMKPSFEI